MESEPNTHSFYNKFSADPWHAIHVLHAIHVIFSKSYTNNITELKCSWNRPVTYPMCWSVCVSGKCTVANG